MQNLEKITISGAGPVGCLLATILASRGHQVQIFEKRPDLRTTTLEAGRSINLVLTLRGLRALDLIDAREEVLSITVPVLGRMMHALDGALAYQPYGLDDSECNYSVPRGELNCFLLDRAEAAGVTIHFQSSLREVRLHQSTLLVDTPDQTNQEHPFEVLFGCDGAPSAVRKALVQAGIVEDRIEMMNSGYKELTFPATPDGNYPLEGHALHIWPRGEHFLMGLANNDHSFTGTLYLPMEGELSFATLTTPDRVQDYFQTYYPDSLELLGDFVDLFLERPVGHLGTVRAAPWHHQGKVLLLGDAAHGIVPFFGQGLNSGFEDCTVFSQLLNQSGPEADFASLFDEFFTLRKPNTDAIADMALENFVEMSSRVADPRFLLKKKVEARLAEDPSIPYRSRYRMVMYSQIPYATAFSIGQLQQTLLDELIDGLDDLDDLDLQKARTLIARDLTPLYQEAGITP